MNTTSYGCFITWDHWPLFLVLFAAHLSADFLFQSDRDVVRKNETGVFLKHLIVVAATAYVLAGLWSAWLLPVLVAATHALLDAAKRRWGSDRPVWFWLDQSAHLAVIAALASAIPYPADQTILWVLLFGDLWWQMLIVAAGVLVSVFAGSVVIGLWAQPFLLEVKKEGGDVRMRGLERGGKTIGRLERAMILVLVLIGQPGGVAFLIAAKSVFRFGELSDRQNRMEAEYITIGTLMSFTWGFVVAWLTQQVLLLL